MPNPPSTEWVDGWDPPLPTQGIVQFLGLDVVLNGEPVTLGPLAWRDGWDEPEA